MTRLSTRRLTVDTSPEVRLKLWARLARCSQVVQRVHGMTPCFEWAGARQSRGYINIKIGGINYIGSALSCWLAHGPRPSSRHEAAHTCDNRSCWNWDHLRWATHRQNQGDKIRKKNGKTRPNSFLEVGAGVGA